MPYKSLKQERYINWAAKKGKIKQSVADEFNEASKGKKLPEYAPGSKFKKLKEKLRK